MKPMEEFARNMQRIFPMETIEIEAAYEDAELTQELYNCYKRMYDLDLAIHENAVGLQTQITLVPSMKEGRAVVKRFCRAGVITTVICLNSVKKEFYKRQTGISKQVNNAMLDREYPETVLKVRITYNREEIAQKMHKQLTENHEFSEYFYNSSVSGVVVETDVALPKDNLLKLEYANNAAVFGKD